MYIPAVVTVLNVDNKQKYVLSVYIYMFIRYNFVAIIIEVFLLLCGAKWVVKS